MQFSNKLAATVRNLSA